MAKERLTMFDEVLDCLADGKPHSFNEVLAYVRIHTRTSVAPSKAQVYAVLRFLEEYDFLAWTSKIKLTPAVVQFLKQIKTIEKGGS
jgi:hypothetical protein